MPKITRTRLVSLDLLRTLAIVGTIIIHTYHPMFARTDFVSGISWWLINCLYTFSRSAIPLFIMISGYLMLAKDESYSKTLKRTLQRLVVPLLFWYSFYTCWNWWYLHYTWNWRGYIEGFYTGSMLLMYFLVILAGLYLFTPLLRVLIAHFQIAKRRLLKLSLILLTIASVLTTVEFFILRSQGNWNVLTMWIPYLGYFLFGYSLRQLSLTSQARLRVGVLLAVVSIMNMLVSFLAVRSIGGHFDFIWLNQSELFFGLYLSPGVIAQSLLLFTFVYSAEYSLLKLPKQTLWVIMTISGAAFGMYLTHAIIINVLDVSFGFDILNVTNRLWLHALLKGTLVFCGSLILSLLIIRLPWLKKLVGSGRDGQN